MTTGTAFVLGGDELYREAGYVALSRGRHENHLYLVAPQASAHEHARTQSTGTPLAAVARPLAASRAQTMAADAPLATELAERTTDALRGEREELRRELAATESRQRSRDRLAEQRATAERLLVDAEGRAATSGLPGDVAAARQAGHRVTNLRERETQLAHRNPAAPQPTQRRLAAIDAELEQRAARTGRMAEVAPADYLLAMLGPRPERLAQRVQWRQAAWRIEQARDATGHTDPHDALGTEPRDLGAREVWRDARREIDRHRRSVDSVLNQPREAPSQRELG